MKAIVTKGLTKKYGELVAVDGLDLEIEEGELFSLLGLNGAGKTSTVKMLSCLTRPDGGEAKLGGFDLLGQRERVKELIGVSPQETAVAPSLSVKENLEFICGIHGFSREKTTMKLRELEKQFALTEFMEKKAGKLSGGWQRRLSIAMALISEPQILFLDEPSLGLDVIARQELWELIRSLKGKVTIILTTHYMEEAQALSDRIGIMQKGRLLALGTAEQLMERTGTGDLERAFVSLIKEEKI